MIRQMSCGYLSLNSKGHVSSVWSVAVNDTIFKPSDSGIQELRALELCVKALADVYNVLILVTFSDKALLFILKKHWNQPFFNKCQPYFLLFF